MGFYKLSINNSTTINKLKFKSEKNKQYKLKKIIFIFKFHFYIFYPFFFYRILLLQLLNQQIFLLYWLSLINLFCIKLYLQ